MAGKITYTPFIPKPIPESKVVAPISISTPIPEYRGADPSREVIPIQYTLPKGANVEPKEATDDSFKWAKLTLHSPNPVQETSAKTNLENESA